MGKNFFRQSEADKREAALDQRLEQLAAEEDWTAVVEKLDRFEENNDWRHEEHRACLDLSLMDRDAEDDQEGCQFRKFLKLCRAQDWDDLIFSQAPEDLHQLVTEYPVSSALKELTPIQRKILWANVVWGVPTSDLARELGCSVRNITKHQQRALEKVRFLVTGRKEPDP